MYKVESIDDTIILKNGQFILYVSLGHHKLSEEYHQKTDLYVDSEV